MSIFEEKAKEIATGIIKKWKDLGLNYVTNGKKGTVFYGYELKARRNDPSEQEGFKEWMNIFTINSDEAYETVYQELLERRKNLEEAMKYTDEICSFSGIEYAIDILSSAWEYGD